MTWIVPVELEEAVRAAAQDVVGEGPLVSSVLARAIIDRSERYTSDRERLAAPTNRTGDLAARAAFFTICDAFKIAIPFAELANRGAIPTRRPLRVVDVGAGCGALGLGLVAQTTEPLEILAIDHDTDALRIAGGAIRRFSAHRGTPATVTTRAADVTTTEFPPADLVVMGNVLNELPPTARRALLDRALAAIDDTGAVIAIEPALRDTTRALHELRDEILEAGSAYVFAPCTRRGAPCPALADVDDWCHEDRAVTLPPRTAELARLTHLRDGGLKFSYLVLRKSPHPLVDAAGSAWRVVSAPHAPKGKLELFGCSDAGRIPIRLLRRNRSDANRPFERAHRGDVLVIAATPDDTRVEIAKDTQVDRVDPAGHKHERTV